MVVVEQATVSLADLDSPLALRCCPADELVPDALMAPLVVVKAESCTLCYLVSTSTGSQVVMRELDRVLGHYAVGAWNP